MERELLKKYCHNACTEDEIDTVLEWFRSSAGKPEGKALLKKIWEEITDDEDDSGVDFDHILDKIHHKVNLDESVRLIKKSDNNPVKYRKKERFLTVFTRVAAILLMPVLCFGLYMSYRYQISQKGLISATDVYNEVYSSVDAITKVTLPDGTKVWLNHRSSLRYPAIFRGNIRNVELKGEGYFEVAHNEKVPFNVNAGGINIVAHGTTFNVCAYPEDDRIETSLIEGAVEVESFDSIKNTVFTYKMKPSYFAVYNKQSGKIAASKIDDNRYYSWKDGKLIFKNEPIGEVTKELCRWFNVDIQIIDSRLFDLTYTATFEHENLSQVMELLTVATPISYTISKREKMDDGTFSKQKVVLTFRKKCISSFH